MRELIGLCASGLGLVLAPLLFLRLVRALRLARRLTRMLRNG